MAKAPTSYDKYRSDFAAFQAGLPAADPTWLDETRKRGLEAFNDLGFPTATRGNERWKYTNVSPIAGATFEYPREVDTQAVSLDHLSGVAPWDESWARMVFVDGRFSPELSSLNSGGDGLEAGNLSDLVQVDGDLAASHLSRLAPVEDDGFTAVNTAFLRDAAVVHVPDDGEPARTLHLVFVATAGPSPTVSYPRTLVVAGRHSRLSVVESYVGLSDSSYFTNGVTEMVLGEGAQVEHYRYMVESPEAFHIGTTRVQIERDATFRSLSFAKGARIARNDLNVLLDGPGASCFLNGLYATTDAQHIDNHINIDHARSHTSSDQYFKGVLDGRSRAVFSGRVLVRRDAQKTYAKQADKNLMLSRGARVNTKPSLEIFADDVQAFHGATAGAVPDDALFYMKSRGVDERTARELLVYGFAREIIDRVKLRPLEEHLDGMFDPGIKRKG